jgi:hypothetical protein
MTNENLLDLTNKLIDEAETLFGKRICDWNFNGVEYNDRQPSLKYYPETGHVTISLSHKAIDDDMQRIFQLSHEVCHLLHPSQEYPSLLINKTLVINEGVSTYFSILKTHEYFDNSEFIIDNLKTYSNKYYEAYLLVKELLEYDNNSLKALREQNPRIDKLKIDDFDCLKFDLAIEFKKKLVSHF